MESSRNAVTDQGRQPRLWTEIGARIVVAAELATAVHVRALHPPKPPAADGESAAGTEDGR